jgi:hypothetical protein
MTIDPTFPRTVIIPYADLLKSALKLCGYPPEMAETHQFEFIGDVSAGQGCFTLQLRDAKPKDSR